jgi:hypothetical protein
MCGLMPHHGSQHVEPHTILATHKISSDCLSKPQVRFSSLGSFKTLTMLRESCEAMVSGFVSSVLSYPVSKLSAPNRLSPLLCLPLPGVV